MLLMICFRGCQNGWNRILLILFSAIMFIFSLWLLSSQKIAFNVFYQYCIFFDSG